MCACATWTWLYRLDLVVPGSQNVMEKAPTAVFAACLLLSCLSGWAVRGENASGSSDRGKADVVLFLRSEAVAGWFANSSRDAPLAAQLALEDLTTAGAAAGNYSLSLELVSGNNITATSDNTAVLCRKY